VYIKSLHIIIIIIILTDFHNSFTTFFLLLALQKLLATLKPPNILEHLQWWQNE